MAETWRDKTCETCTFCCKSGIKVSSEQDEWQIDFYLCRRFPPTRRECGKDPQGRQDGADNFALVKTPYSIWQSACAEWVQGNGG